MLSKSNTNIKATWRTEETVQETVQRSCGEAVLRAGFACLTLSLVLAAVSPVMSAQGSSAAHPHPARAAQHAPKAQHNSKEPCRKFHSEHPPEAKRIALIGPLSDDVEDMVGAWGGAGNGKDIVTVRAALEQRAQRLGGTLVYAKGTEIDGDSESGFAEAVEAAKSADVAVLALGEAGMMSGEAGSRAYLDLPGNQQRLLEAVAATGKPVVLLVFSGRPLVLDWASKHVVAIMEVWFPGTEAGNAIAEVLYGDVSPSGKLPMSFPRAVGQEPLYYNQFPTGRPALGLDLSKPPGGDSRFFSRYIDVPNDALFPFGYGLSYSTFSYGDVKVSTVSVPLTQAMSNRKSAIVTATATVTNTGSRQATEVVQCYVRNLGASMEQPVRSLEGFKRVTLQAGESKQVSFDLGFNELSFYNLESKPTIEATKYTVWIGGSSLADKQASFEVVASSVP